jgi:ribosomal protein S18 acetylase RimI-like enzyme/ribosomal protein S27AE
MSDGPTVRAADPDEAGRLREIARSSFTTSYALSPDDIEGIVEVVFAEDALRDRVESSDHRLFVGEVDDVVAGFAEVSMDGDDGTVRWVHVDPERRGLGVGTALFERAVSELEEEEAGGVRATTLAANTSAGTFFERMDFERIEERTVEIGGRDTVEYVYERGEVEDRASSAEPSDDSGSPEDTAREDVELPEEVSIDGGETTYPGEDLIQGSEGWFAVTFADEDRTEEYGYYCVNCGSTDVSMNSMERLRCDNCGNTSKAGEDYDGSYL